MTNPLAQDLGGVVLLPCPFCGSAAHMYSHTHHPGQPDGWCVMCNNTECKADCYVDRNSQEDAITAWNTRAHSAEIAGALRDAERYRWLKCNCQHMPDELGIAGQLYFGTYAWGDLDTAIDSAMQQGGGGE